MDVFISPMHATHLAYHTLVQLVAQVNTLCRPNHEAHHTSQCLHSSVTPSRHKPNMLEQSASGLLHAERRVRLKYRHFELWFWQGTLRENNTI